MRTTKSIGFTFLMNELGSLDKIEKAARLMLASFNGVSILHNLLYWVAKTSFIGFCKFCSRSFVDMAKNTKHLN